jgi:hypothetical protein
MGQPLESGNALDEARVCIGRRLRAFDGATRGDREEISSLVADLNHALMRSVVSGEVPTR